MTIKILFFSLFLLFFFSCKDRNEETPVAEIDKLPAATQTGANTAGCLVNGKAFVAKGYFPGGSGLICNYNDGKDFTLSISENVDNIIRSVIIFSLNKDLHNNVGITFQLGEHQTQNSKYGVYLINASPPQVPTIIKLLQL